MTPTTTPKTGDAGANGGHREVESIFQADDQTPAADERDVLVTLVEAYENRHYDFGLADPVEAIKFQMEPLGLTASDLEPFIGPSGRVPVAKLCMELGRASNKHKG